MYSSHRAVWIAPVVHVTCCACMLSSFRSRCTGAVLHCMFCLSRIQFSVVCSFLGRQNDLMIRPIAIRVVSWMGRVIQVDACVALPQSGQIYEIPCSDYLYSLDRWVLLLLRLSRTTVDRPARACRAPPPPLLGRSSPSRSSSSGESPCLERHLYHPKAGLAVGLTHYTRHLILC